MPATKGSHPKGRMASETDSLPSITFKMGFLVSGRAARRAWRNSGTFRKIAFLLPFCIMCDLPTIPLLQIFAKMNSEIVKDIRRPWQRSRQELQKQVFIDAKKIYCTLYCMFFACVYQFHQYDSRRFKIGRFLIIFGIVESVR